MWGACKCVFVGDICQGAKGCAVEGMSPAHHNTPHNIATLPPLVLIPYLEGALLLAAPVWCIPAVLQQQLPGCCVALERHHPQVRGPGGQLTLPVRQDRQGDHQQVGQGNTVLRGGGGGREGVCVCRCVSNKLYHECESVFGVVVVREQGWEKKTTRTQACLILNDSNQAQLNTIVSPHSPPSLPTCHSAPR